MTRSPNRKSARAQGFGHDSPDIIRGAKNNDLEEVEAAIAADPESILQIDAVTGMTAIHYACALSNLNMILFLMDQDGLDMRKKDRFGRDALDVAIESGRQDVIKWIFLKNEICSKFRDSSK